MLRFVHRWPGLVAAILVICMSLSGAALSVFPALESLSTPAQTDSTLDVGTVAARIQAAQPAVSEIRVSPAGRVTAFWFDTNNQSQASVIDPATGKAVANAETPAAERWLKNLHRSLFLGENGRIVTAVGALLMLVLSVSGLFLVARRTGGWKRFFSPLRGASSARVHVELARVSVAGLLLSSLTALWMTASTFGILPESADGPAMPAVTSGRTGYGLDQMPTLSKLPIDALRDLTFPAQGDVNDVYTLKTTQGTGYIDQGNGKLLAWSDASIWDSIGDTVMMLHTGRGAALLGLILGLMSLAVPALAVTGAIQWWASLKARPRIRGNASAGRAGTVILVGSEGGATWGFAATLHAAVAKTGEHVHVAPMSAFEPQRYSAAKRIIVMAATYGDGDAPASARNFLSRLATNRPLRTIPVSVLGFGDRSFPHFCGFAQDVDAELEKAGWAKLLPLETVDRQSPQDFARWGRALGEKIGIPLDLHHATVVPQLTGLTLISRRDFGAAVQAPAAILRFALPRTTLWQRLTGDAPRFSAGDLIGIVPHGSNTPRFYSLASSSRDGFVEICVRKHPGGLCSSRLVDLMPGDKIHVFFRPNPDFRPAKNRKPVVLIGAGTGIGPLAGFVRANDTKRPMHLFFGARHPSSDVFYAPEIDRWLNEGKLTSIETAFSRTAARSYVQDAVRRDGQRLAGLIASGAQIMVCGGADMAAGVKAALGDILAPMNLTTAKLKAEGRYAEDVY
ncbi:PepSY domain-containing protein [Rhizobium sp. C4]|uniref:PepSY domain-containing protein n=1 Tax=Rhizobium sp. C4 TaxID=1349800 RepID=UPI001E31222E|nr:PepSY domain-containing protein [Rhizobium sp. C4]MCD2172274.1 PepSY domain-containing protein [Rhizobium sp. C4]